MRQVLLFPVLSIALCGVFYGACVDRSEVGAFGEPDAAAATDAGEGASEGGAADGAEGEPLNLEPSQTPIAAGGLSTCARNAAGGIVCWGDNAHGTLGTGSFMPSMSEAAVPVSGLSKGVRAVAGGPFAQCAILDDGTARCWGDSLFGDIGGTTDHVQMPSPHDKTGLSNDVAEIGFGFHFACALTRTGRAKCWGLGGGGQLGTGSNDDTYIAKDVATAERFVHLSPSMGGLFACAVAVDGSAFCWGKNGSLQLGSKETTDQNKPVPVEGLGAKATRVGAGRAHACALLEDGAVACWGSDEKGQLGRGSAGAPSAPIRVAGVTGAKSIAVGSDHACALVGSGAVLCWGAGDAGQIGGAAASLPPTESFPASFAAIAVTAGIGHTCALDAAGRVRCIGASDRDQTGKGDFTL